MRGHWLLALIPGDADRGSSEFERSKFFGGGLCVEHVELALFRCVKPVQRFLKKGWCDEYIRIGRFTLTVLTPSERSKRMLERQVAPYLLKILKQQLAVFNAPKNTLPFKVSVEQVPQLDLLLLSPRSSSRPTKKEQQ